jgi:hypothetical protein
MTHQGADVVIAVLIIKVEGLVESIRGRFDYSSKPCRGAITYFGVFVGKGVIISKIQPDVGVEF